MIIKILMTSNAIVAILFVIIPSHVYSLYCASLGKVVDVLNYMAQLFGAALIGIGFAVTLIEQINNVVNVIGWSTVVIYFLLALGFGYFQFSKTNSTESLRSDVV